MTKRTNQYAQRRNVLSGLCIQYSLVLKKKKINRHVAALLLDDAKKTLVQKRVSWDLTSALSKYTESPLHWAVMEADKFLMYFKPFYVR